ncbi:UPF0149 family protein [Alteromonas sp. ASW11-19]|uniref:UPF0149 family protein n=1 Tax=Alteromonas salexigens TaxID=2982530 RepID=A0ABT2VT62_9ALTE|nr:UPF0149 family protein [Alteromonas salexigens]MCU7555431.1 UPF0149 family protein [Alteromonas salexigens]
METLHTLCSHPTIGRVLPPFHQADGLIFAVAASPDIPMPEIWMPWVISQSGDTLVSDDVDRLADALMHSLRTHLDAMRQQAALVPDACQWQQGAVIPTELECWLGGLLQGHQLLEPTWRAAWERKAKTESLAADAEDPAARLSRCLKLFSTLANSELALAQRSPANAEALRQHLPTLWRQLPAMLQEYVDLAGELAQALPNQFETFQQDPQT